MKILTQSEFKTRIQEVYSMARLCKLHHSEINERLTRFIRSEIHRTTGKDKRAVYPVLMQGAVMMAMEIYDDLHSQNVEYCYEYNGLMYSTHTESTKFSIDEMYNAGIDLSKCRSGFVYKNSDKVYYGFEAVKAVTE
jgi:hypothetical protein